MIEYNSNNQSLINYISVNWKFRSLIFSFVKRDLKIKYAQTFLGITWALIQPIGLAAVYLLFFQFVFTVKIDQPFILFVFSGVIIWNVFSTTILQASLSIQQNQDLIKKMYFPKPILLISKSIVAIIDGLIAWVLLVILMLIFSDGLSWYFFTSLFFFIPLVFFSLGLSLIIARLAIMKRDILIALPFFIQLSVWFTPVFYPLTSLPKKWIDWLELYPVNSILEGFRACFDLNKFSWIPIMLSSVVGLIIFFLGFYLFAKTDDRIIDEL